MRPDLSSPREFFSSRAGLLLTTVGVAVGLGNVWRFPYMAGRYGGTAFVLVYLAAAFLVGVPALAAEWTLGRWTRRGPVGAFDRAGLPGGRGLGYLFFLTVTAATAYYSNAIGWVLYHGVGELASAAGGRLGPEILPPDAGFDVRSFLLQVLCTAGVVGAAAAVLRRGLRSGVERASVVLTPLLFGTLVLLVARSLTLEGAGEGVAWYLLKFEPGDLTGAVVLAALGQAIFSLALGGTFMVVYGSHMDGREPLARNAVWTAVGDTAAGLLAGFAIFPAVFALGLEPGSGPDLVFSTLPSVFRRLPAGWVFGTLFFLSLAGGAFLSALAAFEVIVAGLTDELGLERKRAVRAVALLVFLFALPPMLNMEVFVPWDLAFGSGMQTAGALAAVVTVGWALDRGAALGELAAGGASVPESDRAEGGGGPAGAVSPDAGGRGPAAGPGWKVRFLYLWIRWVVPAAVTTAGVWWLATEVL